MALWQKSGLSVRAYCKEQGVVETSFYAWRRELIVRTRESNSSGRISNQDEKAPPTVQDSRGRTIPIRFRESEKLTFQSNESSGNPFVPLSIVHQNLVEKPEGDTLAGLKVTTPSGYRILVSSANDLHLLEKVLSILENRQC